VPASPGLRQQLAALQQQYRQQRWRLALWLQHAEPAQQQWLAHTVAELLADQAPDAGFWLGERPAAWAPPALGSQITHKGQLLGAEADWIVMNGLAGIDWDLLAAASGCLRAGGLWLLITLEPLQLAQQANPLAQRLLSYPLLADSQPSNFQQFWLSQQLDGWRVTAEQGLYPQSIAVAAASTKASQTEITIAAAPYSTLEQQQAVAAILKVVSGHRRRPLLLTAHRGRGKSAALGLAAAQLQQLGKHKLIITAPHPSAATVALQHAKDHLAALLPQATLALQFWPIDVLLKEKPSADLVLVDEAAAIPLPQLQQLTQYYSRLVFATTEHGYEGTGRSFSLKFQPYLQQNCPGWQQFRLQAPIRYAADDPLERQIFRSFLLDCDAATPRYEPTLPLFTRLHPASELLAEPHLLASLFGLLSLAHYQTEVTDLWALLDNPQLQVMALYQQPASVPGAIASPLQLLGCAVISFEGRLPAPLSMQIFQGERRVQGHLLAQSLAFHLAAPELATLPLARVQRIVIHPAIQNCGLGRFLLHAVQHYVQQSGIAILGSSFGATPSLLRFWMQQGFLPLKLSSQAGQASGEPSVLLVKSLHSEVLPVVLELSQRFSRQLYLQLADSQRRLNPALALQLCQPPAELADQDIEVRASSRAQQQLALFAAGKRPYELVECSLLAWFNQHALSLPSELSTILVQKLWQKHSWDALRQQTGLGKPQLLDQIRRVVARAFPQEP